MKIQETQFTQLVREHKSTIYSVCYMFSKDQDEVDDLFQEVLIKLWQGYDKFEGRSNLRTWVYKVSLNTCISIDRKKKSRPTQAILEGVDLFDDTDTDNKQLGMLHDRITQLPPFDRAIVLLWLENMSYDEIGAIVGITPKNVSVRLYRIKEQLKKMSSSKS
ncbi:MAG: sigma-70 family RNA polymerase sigma factor [Muribaculaceae bacterium]|nr:sigma-70 family RNA polymerase sigma factor [Muribaculaceae bacterium]